MLAQGDCDGTSADGIARVENTPFSAQRRVTTITRNADGSSSRAEETASEARDGKGRTYSAGERRWTTVVGNERVQKSEILVRIFDPVANTSTTWSSGAKEVKVVHWPPQAGNTGAGEPFLNPFSDSRKGNSDIRKLGTKTIEGVLAQGIRVSYTIPAQVKGDKKTAFVHECWYSPELKIAILGTDDDPRRSSSFTNQLEKIVRGEPDLAKYQPPADYSRQTVEVDDQR